MIPSTAHFIWLGNSMPWACTIAVRSALAFGGFDRAVLHYEPGLEGSSAWKELESLSGLEMRTIDARKLFEPIERHGISLAPIYDSLTEPAGRANVLRAAILFREGGVYLDMDTITVRSLDVLRQSCGAFCGEEHIVWPGMAGRRRTISDITTAIARRQVRALFRLASPGWRWFRRVEQFYLRGVNNAVLGCSSEHALITRLLFSMSELPPSNRTIRYALGTHLLQKIVSEAQESDVQILEPAVFYPLGPEISAHWFRLRNSLPSLSEIVSSKTLVVHWYASVRTKRVLPLINEKYVREHSSHQLFSALACSVLDGTTPDLIADVPRKRRA